jgi:hypothetical protein
VRKKKRGEREREGEGVRESPKKKKCSNVFFEKKRNRVFTWREEFCG